MNAKATRMLLTAVALSALAAVLASFAQARIPEGNGTQPPSKTVVIKQQSLQERLASSARARIPEGNGTQPPFKTVATEQQAQLVTGTFFFSFTPDPAIYVVYGALISYERQARQGAERSRARRPSNTSSPRATAAFRRRRATPRGEDGAANAPSLCRQPRTPSDPGRYEEDAGFKIVDLRSGAH